MGGVEISEGVAFARRSLSLLTTGVRPPIPVADNGGVQPARGRSQQGEPKPISPGSGDLVLECPLSIRLGQGVELQGLILDGGQCSGRADFRYRPIHVSGAFWKSCTVRRCAAQQRHGVRSGPFCKGLVERDQIGDLGFLGLEQDNAISEVPTGFEHPESSLGRGTVSFDCPAFDQGPESIDDLPGLVAVGPFEDPDDLAQYDS